MKTNCTKTWKSLQMFCPRLQKLLLRCVLLEISNASKSNIKIWCCFKRNLSFCLEVSYKLSNEINIKNLFFYLVHTNHFFKYVIWGTVRPEILHLGTVLWWTVRRETVPQENIFRELSVGQRFIGKISIGELSGYHFCYGVTRNFA